MGRGFSPVKIRRKRVKVRNSNAFPPVLREGRGRGEEGGNRRIMKFIGERKRGIINYSSFGRISVEV